MQCLLDILRGYGFDRSTGEAELGLALTMAEEEHLLPYVAARLRSENRTLLPSIATRLQQIERDAAIAAFYWCSELRGVLRALHQSNVAVIPLKGPLLADQLYGSAALRVSRDLDILVSKSDLPRAEAVLTSIGFAPGSADDYHRPWRRHSTTVELHHDVENPLAFNFHVEGAIRRAMPADFEGQPCLRLAPEDELIFLCLHAARHRYERLSLIVDLQLAFEKLPHIHRGWHRRPETAELDNLVVLGLAMARRLEPGLAVSFPGLTPGKQTGHLEDLADCLWNRLLTRPTEPLDWRAAHSFFLKIEPPGWSRLRRRCRHLRILLTRIIEPDYAFAVRFGLSRPWQVRVLRPLRLLSDWAHRKTRSSVHESADGV